MIQESSNTAFINQAAQAKREKTETMHTLLSPAQVIIGLELDNKKQVFQHIAQNMAQACDVSEDAILSVMWEREQLGSTAVGGGLAIPHGRLNGITQVYGCFLQLSPAVAFEAATDAQPIDLVFALLAPATAGADHLRALSLVAGIMRPEDFRNACRRAPTAAALHKLLIDEAYG
jgi:nitrogen PTS system EIIA component